MRAAFLWFRPHFQRVFGSSSWLSWQILFKINLQAEIHFMKRHICHAVLGTCFLAVLLYGTVRKELSISAAAITPEAWHGANAKVVCKVGNF